MTPELDTNQNYEPMAVVEKYETVIKYLYPIAENLPRKHGVARDMFLTCLLGQVQLFVEAGKSNQVSRLYIADAGLSHLRFWLRFLCGDQVRGITPHQVQTAQVLIAEVGKMLGAWIIKQKRRG
ncbi:MAG: diversity-generating retroelement protein Avd [Hydrogenophaga sp.]|jgi:hypothetical protein|nr:diversity-generating retroelement protein Avd [Hydrogenophaga sp.]